MERLFWHDPYLVEAQAVVTSVDGNVVTLDRTVAYAFAGGQQSDVGTIGGAPIVRATTDGAEIRYELPPGHGHRPGDRVTVAIDWPTRYRVMRLHSAAEVVLELVNQRHGAPEKVGANVTVDKARIDFAWHGNIAEILPELTREVERIVQADLPILGGPGEDGSRAWGIEGFASVPCCGTHPRRTGEIGAVALRRANRGAGTERIEIRLNDE